MLHDVSRDARVLGIESIVSYFLGIVGILGIFDHMSFHPFSK